MRVQAQPDSSSLPPSDLDSAEDKPAASAAPDTNHLWLVSDRGLVVHGDWMGHLPGTRPSRIGAAPLDSVARSALEPPNLGQWCCYLLGLLNTAAPSQNRTFLRGQRAWEVLASVSEG